MWLGITQLFGRMITITEEVRNVSHMKCSKCLSVLSAHACTADACESSEHLTDSNYSAHALPRLLLINTAYMVYWHYIRSNSIFIRFERILYSNVFTAAFCQRLLKNMMMMMMEQPLRLTSGKVVPNLLQCASQLPDTIPLQWSSRNLVWNSCLFADHFSSRALFTAAFRRCLVAKTLTHKIVCTDDKKGNKICKLYNPCDIVDYIAYTSVKHLAPTFLYS